VTALMRLDKAATTAAVQVEDLISGQVVMGMVGLRPCDTRHSRHRGTAYGQMQKLTAGKFHVEPPLPSFDHFLRPPPQFKRGAQRKCRRDAQPKRRRGLEVDYQLELGRRLNRKIAGFLAA